MAIAPRKETIGLGITLLFLAFGADATTIDFNTPGDLVNNFQWNSNGPRAYTQVTSGGIANSGAVDLATLTDGTELYVAGGNSFDFTQVGTTLSISQYIKAQTATSANGQTLHIGFLGDSGDWFNNPSGNAYMSLILHVNAWPDYDLEVAYEDASGAETRTSVTGTAALVSGNWYKLSTDFIRLSGTDIRVTAQLDDYGTAGTTFQSTVLTATPFEFSLPDMANDAWVWGGFMGF